MISVCCDTMHMGGHRDLCIYKRIPVGLYGMLKKSSSLIVLLFNLRGAYNFQLPTKLSRIFPS